MTAHRRDGDTEIYTVLPRGWIGSLGKMAEKVYFLSYTLSCLSEFSAAVILTVNI